MGSPFKLLVCVLLVSALAGTAAAVFPDLSSFPLNSTEIDLSFQDITHVPANAFANFTALQFL
jgi:hypothetical protein